MKMFINLTLLVKCDTVPVLRYSPDGKPVATFWASTLTGDEQYRELGRYYVSLYGPKAERLNTLPIEAGHLLLVRGSLIGDDKGAPRVHTRQDQTTFTAWEVQAQDVVSIEGGQVTDSQQPYGYQAVDLVGNLGQDPKTNQTQGGKTVANLSIACNVYDAAKAAPTTVWVRVAFWGNSYTKVIPTLRKGRKVFVSGVLKSDENGGPRMWTDQNGQIKASFEMTGFRLQYADPKPVSGGTVQPVAAGFVPEEELPF